jgi:ligand-binding sensor domain-containing protein
MTDPATSPVHVRARALTSTVADAMVSKRSGNFLSERSVALGLFILWGLLATPALAGWRTFSTGDGLVHNNVRCIAEDNRENLWFATQEGVNRFDGVSWTTITTADGLPSNNVHIAFAARDGGIWFGGQSGGVALVIHDTLQALSQPEALASYAAWKITQGRGNRIWFASLGGGAFWYEDGVWGRITAADGMPSNNLISILEDRDGDLWVGTNGAGVGHRHGSAWTRYTTSNGLSGNSVRAIIEDDQHNLWFATEKGVSRRNVQGEWRSYTTADGLAGDDVYSVLQDRHGDLWFGTRFLGVSRFDGRSWEKYPVLDGLGAWNITQDRSGNLWFGSSGGATRYDGSDMTTFPQLLGPEVLTTLTIMEDSNGAIWFGTKGSAYRFDGTSWTEWNAATTGGQIGKDWVGAVLEDRNGNYWFNSWDEGITRWDGDTTWTHFDKTDGMASNQPRKTCVDQAGKIWVASPEGVSVWDGNAWRAFRTVDGLAGDDAFWVTPAQDGAVWIGTESKGVSRFGADSTWTTYTTANGLGGNRIWGITQDSSGAMWFGTVASGATRFDGSAWTTFTSKDGLVNDNVLTISEDRRGNHWFALDLSGGICRWDGTNWRNLGASDGLPTASVSQILEARNGDLWIGTFNGMARYRPDYVPPRTVLLRRPPTLSASPRQSCAFAALGESDRIEYSYRLDGGIWSEWSSTNLWSEDNLLDGLHTLEVRARDYWVNVDETPEVATFEIDATPPIAVLFSPVFGAPVRGVVEIRGAASDARFRSYRVDLRDAKTSSWDSGSVVKLAQSFTPVAGGFLENWDTSPYPDGIYDLRLSVTDSLGLSGYTQVTVVVDNKAPYADQTTPATIRAASGGDVYTVGAEVHLYFPPHAFSEDAVVTIVPADESIPDPPTNSTAQETTAFAISWSSGVLRKPARLELTYGSDPPPSRSLAVYRSQDGSGWERLGGTVDPAGRRVALTISEPGLYSLYTDDGLQGGGESLSELVLTPRVFSPSGTFADRHVGISFTLGRAGPVTVKVYSRSGRLVREVASGVSMGAGENLIPWDGKDRDGDVVSDDLYFVTVEAFGKTKKQTLAVVK